MTYKLYNTFVKLIETFYLNDKISISSQQLTNYPNANRKPVTATSESCCVYRTFSPKRSAQTNSSNCIGIDIVVRWLPADDDDDDLCAQNQHRARFSKRVRATFPLTTNSEIDRLLSPLYFWGFEGGGGGVGGPCSGGTHRWFRSITPLVNLPFAGEVTWINYKPDCRFSERVLGVDSILVFLDKENWKLGPFMLHSCF